MNFNVALLLEVFGRYARVGIPSLWRIVDDNHDRYSAYQKMTARAIPVIVVTPA